MIVVQNVAKAKTVLLPILTDYPLKDPTKVGQRFWYQGIEWHYMSQPEIDALGWPETAGFPAPFYKMLYFGNSVLENNFDPTTGMPNIDSYFDALGYGHLVNKIKIITFNGRTLSTPKNFHLLTSLQDLGTEKAFNFLTGSATKLIIDAIFQQLPVTTKVASINVNGCPGAATCNTSIATTKGYIVIT
jgi:hypothetical protein